MSGGLLENGERKTTNQNYCITIKEMKIKKDSNENYHSRPEISASGLKTIHKKSVYHFLNQRPFSSDSLALGTAVHEAILEPKEFDKKYAIVDYIPRGEGYMKKRKEQQEDHKGKELLYISNDKEQPGNIILNIKRQFMDNDLAIFYTKGDIELSHYGMHNGVPVRVRPDVKGDGWISDIKTCQDNSPRAFLRDIYNYGYHLQAAFYSDALGFDPKRFRFIAIETKHPFSVVVYGLSDEMIDKGRLAYQNALEEWNEYLQTGIANGYGTSEMAKDGSLIL